VRLCKILIIQTATAATGTMNISSPVTSAISGVAFSFLGWDEIKALSVKRISSPVTFDTLLHPVPGGLYDPALGAFLDNLYDFTHSDPISQEGVRLIDYLDVRHAI
jgi:hypothetical protein